MSIAKILDLYARYGRSLIDAGLTEAAIPLVYAAEALEIFGELKWLILGGDVYKEDDNGLLESTYENWFYDGGSSQESIIEARSFINGLNGREVFVVFVLAISK